MSSVSGSKASRRRSGRSRPPWTSAPRPSWTRLIAGVQRGGPIDLFCSNAGINGPVAGPETPDDVWGRIWRINVMSHVWAARALLPSMRQRGEGYLLNTASAAGLLTNLGMLPYSATKHAAVGVAEWLAITYWDEGIRVSCLCPQLVDTPMLHAIHDEPVLERAMAAAGETLPPAEVAAVTVRAVEREEFLILPHREVRDHATRRAADNERWLRGCAGFGGPLQAREGRPDERRRHRSDSNGVAGSAPRRRAFAAPRRWRSRRWRPRPPPIRRPGG